MDTWLANKNQSLGIFKINMKSNLTSFTFIIDIPGHTFNDSLVHIIPKNTIVSLKSFMKMSELNFTFYPLIFNPSSTITGHIEITVSYLCWSICNTPLFTIQSNPVG